MWRDDVWRGIQQIWIERFFFISILISSVFTFYFLIRWESNWNQFECIVAVGMWNVPTKAKQGREDKKCILLNLFSVFFQILNWNLYFPIISINFFSSFLLPRSAVLSPFDSAHFVEMKKFSNVERNTNSFGLWMLMNAATHRTSILFRKALSADSPFYDKAMPF